MRRLIILFLFHLFSYPVFAYQEVVGIVGVGYEENTNNSIKYDATQIKGSSYELLKQTPASEMIFFSENTYQRVGNKYSFVSVPPNTKVNFINWYINNTQEDITLFQSDLFFSRINEIDGDITKLGAHAQYSNYPRKSLNFGTNKIINPNLDTLGEVLYEFETIQPIKIVSFKGVQRDESNGRYIDYELILQNISKYNICEIKIESALPSGGKFEEKVCLDKESDKKIKYTDDITAINQKEITTDGVIVYDNNSHTETITSNLADPFDQSLEASPMVFSTNYGTTLAFGELEESLRVELLPYWIRSDPIKTKIIDKKVQSTLPQVETNTEPPKYSFTIINEIQKENLENDIQEEVLGSQTQNEPIKENFISVWVLVGLISIILIAKIVRFIKRLW